MNPTSARERVVELDILRGVALLGVLIVNFSSGTLGGLQVLGQWDRVVEWLVENFAYGKVYPLFALLFGLGVSAQMRRIGDGFTAFHIRRMAILFAFGLAHMTLIWEGDILHVYALVGLVLPFVITVRAARLLVAAVVLLGIANLQLPIERPWADAQTVAQAGGIEAPRQTDSYGPAVAERVERITRHYLMAPRIRDLDILAMFLVGAVVGRSDFLGRLKASHRMLLKVAVASLAVAALGRLGPVVLRTLGEPMSVISPIIAYFKAYLGSAVAIFYGSTLLLAVEYRGVKRLLSPFAYVGRMSLTNYLTQTFVGSMLFFPYFLGLGGKLGYSLGVGLAAALFSLQIIISALWLERAKFGPFEWLWRSAAYGQWQPLWWKSSLILSPRVESGKVSGR